MIAKGLATLKTAFGRPAEALGSAPVGLHLRHFVSNSWPCNVRTSRFDSSPLKAGSDIARIQKGFLSLLTFSSVPSP
jgi:hypothetical protein